MGRRPPAIGGAAFLRSGLGNDEKPSSPWLAYRYIGMANENTENAMATKSLSSASYKALIVSLEESLQVQNEFAIRNIVVEMASRRGLSHVEMSKRIVRGEYR